MDSVVKQQARRAAGETQRESLPHDIWGVISGDLLPEELLALALTATSMVNCISYETIVQNDSCDRLKFLLASLQSRSIYKPSKLRLLRLLNAKRCESCLRRFVVNKGDLSETGLMLCHACESKLFPDHVTPTRGVKELVLTDPRILSGSSKFNQILGDTFYSGQEPCGPVLTSKVLEYLGENEVTVDEYLETLGSNALDPQIVQAWRDARARSCLTNQVFRHNQQHRDLVDKNLAHILAEVDEQWRPLVADYEYLEGQDIPDFRYKILETILWAALRPTCHYIFPHQVSAALNQTFSEWRPILEFRSLLNGSDLLEAHLLQYMTLQQITVETILNHGIFRQDWGRATEDHFQTLLLCAFWEPPVRTSPPPNFLPPRLVDYIAELLLGEDKRSIVGCLDERQAFARRVCRHVYWKRLFLNDKEKWPYRQVCKSFYETCQRIFDSLLPNIQDYLLDARTNEFMDESERAAKTVRQIWRVKRAGSIQQIAARDFEGLLHLHRCMAQDNQCH